MDSEKNIQAFEKLILAIGNKALQDLAREVKEEQEVVSDPVVPGDSPGGDIELVAR